MINNLELRLRMRKVIRPNLQVLLVIALIAALPELLASVVTMRLLSSFMAAQHIDTSVTLERLVEVLQAFIAERGWMIAVTLLFRLVLAPVLTLGLINAILTLLRGGTAVVGTVFSRLNAFLRAIGVSLLVSVKVLLWSLPGVAIMVAASFLLFQTGSLTLYYILTPIASGTMMVLMFMAVYRYAMAIFYLADDPETGVFACVRQSKAVMKNRKLQLFSLELLYMVGNYVVGMLVSTLLGGVIGSTLSMMVQLIFTVYIYGARCAFFEAYSRPNGGRAHAFQSDPYHDEMKDPLN